MVWILCHFWFCFSLIDLGFFFLGFDLFFGFVLVSYIWGFGFVLISTLFSFRLEITRRVRPAQPMTHADDFDPNIQSAVGLISIHPIQSGRVCVNPNLDLT